MNSEFQKIMDAALADIQKTSDESELRDTEVKYLGRKGELTEMLKKISTVAPEERKEFGQSGNEVKNKISEEIENKLKSFEKEKFAALAEKEWLDPTQPGVKPLRGKMHPISTFIKEIEEVFGGLGFEIATGPEIEDDHHNFTALNIPADHPARDSQDTFFLKNFPQNLLRTQTSSMQIRWCEEHDAPVRIVAPGKCFRKDELDATHSPIFHQFEGLVIDKNISLAHLKGVIGEAFRKLIGENAKFRFRTSYFPFVEPGLEVDASCTMCDGDGCRICKSVGWIEVLGCGMVHPNVLKAVGYDPEVYTGFAFGGGVERMLMGRHQIPDIRYFYENDLRFLHQF